jgi:hypothetical protein
VCIFTFVYRLATHIGDTSHVPRHVDCIHAAYAHTYTYTHTHTNHHHRTCRFFVMKPERVSELLAEGKRIKEEEEKAEKAKKEAQMRARREADK